MWHGESELVGVSSPDGLGPIDAVALGEPVDKVYLVEGPVDRLLLVYHERVRREKRFVSRLEFRPNDE